MSIHAQRNAHQAEGKGKDHRELDLARHLQRRDEDDGQDTYRQLKERVEC